MEDSVLQFVERMGLICEKEGMARSAGRIFGLLLVGGRAFSLDELAEKLQASKASVSTNCRMLEQLGMIQRASSLGDRRDFYKVESDPWAKMLRVAQSRWREMVNVFADTRAALPPQCADGHRRLEEAERFHELLITECDKLLDNWYGLRHAAARATSDAA
ncbi:MAG TPA: MarR family transcriptional regulator [Longimicrobium sp.]|jgi:DNA-binding transcriptional regulator GbsR (MarR family)